MTRTALNLEGARCDDDRLSQSRSLGFLVWCGRTRRSLGFLLQTNKQQQIGGFILALYVLTQFVRENFTTLSNLSFNTAAILKIYFRHLLFHRLSHSWQALIGFDQILLYIPSTRDLGTRLLGNGVLTSLLLNFQIRRLWMNLNQSAASKTKATNVLYQSYSKVSKSS